MITKPIPHHRFHDCDDDMLRYIIKDASEAARCMRNYDFVAECKYLDQVNDASTALRYRAARRGQRILPLPYSGE